MNTIPQKQEIQTAIENERFACIRCGACCREIEPGSNLVLVSPAEVRVIMSATELSFDEIAEPYPDTIQEGEREYTFDWAIRRIDNQCKFLIGGLCSIYHHRPWICRTYPFMLNNGTLMISSCNGIGTNSSDCRDPDVVELLIKDLYSREHAEIAEEKRITAVMTSVHIPPGRLVVVDGEGMRIING